MSSWRETTLGELVTVKHGYAFKGEYFAKRGIEVVLTPGNFQVGGGLQFRDGKERYYTGSYPDEFRLRQGDLLMVMTDLKQEAPILGSPATVPASPPMLHNQRLGLVRVKPGIELDRRYLYYLLLSDVCRSQLRATATGATVRHTAPERIYQVRVRIPCCLKVQRIIGAALGSLDDLSENNRRRIELLEQMVQQIYREWFICFRYPGRMDTPLVDSLLGPIPDGWQVKKVGDVVELKYGKALRASDRRGGSVPVVGSAGVVGLHDESLVHGPCIVVGRKGNVGEITWVDNDCWPIDTTYYVGTKLPLRYVREQLSRADFINSHAAVPGLSRAQAYNLPFLLPPEPIMRSLRRS
jgi:type I restriction enzyme S subunit